MKATLEQQKTDMTGNSVRDMIDSQRRLQKINGERPKIPSKSLYRKDTK